MTSFTQLRAWQASRILAVYTYKITQSFPGEEKFGLTSQIRRSAVSVPANIAEGFSRNSDKDKIQFYSIALGSLTETLSHSYIACDLGFLPQKELKLIEDKVIEIQKMTNGLIKSAARRPGNT
ncbi:four helix bundle protein [Candidatus Parcubacteria bacterium]|nr:four helix bundle protein [Candidatus Parcubacteria bacterium]